MKGWREMKEKKAKKKFGFVLFKYAFSRCDLTVEIQLILQQ